MITQTELTTPQKILALVKHLSLADKQWLMAQLKQLLAEEENITPQKTTLITLEEALTLYRAGECSLGRAAELAGVTRWHLQDILFEQGTPVEIYGHRTATEIDELAQTLEQEGIFELIKPLNPPPNLPHISQERRQILAQHYAVGGPLSEIVIAEREGR